ncbi:hypothetical protein OPV22_034719 [Ensete ventricosum]|uniref:Uncharacterized protein n=1 Tax=Ensete ventricosum TaxID=4639 RepID=A0AAV8PMD1_ENSVE|nr:hypothetical protein OPV22_034719 [Ensete ventricosum]
MTNEACCRGTGERSVVCTITLRIAGKVLPFASFAVRRSPLASGGPKTASFGLFLGRFRVPRRSWRAVRNVSHLSTPGTPRVAQGWMGLSYSREGAARRFVRSPPLAARSGGPKRPVLACFWAVLACCGGRGERLSGRGIRAAGKVLPFASFAVRRSPLAQAAKNGQFWPVFGPFSRAAATAASGAKRQPSQHPGTPRVAQGWMGLSYSREGAARRFGRCRPSLRSLAAARRSLGRPQNGQFWPVFWAVFACCGGRGERSSGRGIGVAGKVLPFASFSVRRSPLARAAKNGQFLACFWAVFACRGDRSERCETSAISAPLEPPGWHRGGWGFRIAGKVPPVASFALRRSPFARAAPKRPVLACFWAVFVCCGGRGERSFGRGIGVAGKVLPFASFAVRRSPLARAAKNGQFWPVFGPFSRAAATVASGAKRQPSQHPGTPRVAQGWMGLSYSREGAAPSLRSLSAARRSLGRPKTASFGLFLGRFRVPRWARERSSGRGIGVAGKVLPFASFAVRRSPLARVAKNGQFWPVFGPFSRAAAIAGTLGLPKTGSFGLFLGRFRVLWWAR